jgi:hypothetical protein
MNSKCPKCGSVKWVEDYGHCFACHRQIDGSLWRRLGKAAAVIEILRSALVSGDAFVRKIALKEVKAYMKVEKAFDRWSKEIK